MSTSAEERARFAHLFDQPTAANLRRLTPGEFPRFILYLFERDGLYHPVFVDGPGDGGIDIELHERNGAHPRLLGVAQCKRYLIDNVTPHHIGYFANAAHLADAERRYYFTTAGYTSHAYRDARINDILTFDPQSIRRWILDIRQREANQQMVDDLPNKDAIPVPIVCFANNKGGVGKTSIVANLAAALTALDKTVLVIDTDPQANLTDWLAEKTPDRLDPMRTLYALYNNGHPLYPLVIRRTVVPGVMVAPAHRHMYNLPPNLAYHQERRLLQAIAALPLGDLKVDIVLIDTQPALYSLTTSAVIAAHYLVFPFRLDEPSEAGIDNLFAFVERVEANHMLPQLRILGGVANCVDNTNLGKVMRKTISEHVYARSQTARHWAHQQKFWIGDLRARAQYPVAQREHISVLHSKLKARDAVDDIMRLAKEVLDRVNGYPVTTN